MSSGSGHRRNEELRTRHRRARSGALLVSVALHILVFVIFRGESGPSSPFAAAGPRRGDERAAPAGGGMQVLNLRLVPPQPAPVIPIPAPVEVVEPEPEPDPEPEPEPAEAPAVEVEAAVDAGSGGTRSGVGELLGVEGGTGRGDGGTEAEGRFRATPPTPRGLILPPGDRPGKVRGKEVTVWVYVTEMGVVVADSTRLSPPTGDAKFDERLRRQAAEWVFQPAQRGGKAVAEWFRYVISL